MQGGNTCAKIPGETLHAHNCRSLGVGAAVSKARRCPGQMWEGTSSGGWLALSSKEGGVGNYVQSTQSVARLQLRQEMSQSTSHITLSVFARCAAAHAQGASRYETEHRLHGNIALKQKPCCVKGGREAQPLICWRFLPRSASDSRRHESSYVRNREHGRGISKQRLLRSTTCAGTENSKTQWRGKKRHMTVHACLPSDITPA